MRVTTGGEPIEVSVRDLSYSPGSGLGGPRPRRADSTLPIGGRQLAYGRIQGAPIERRNAMTAISWVYGSSECVTDGIRCHSRVRSARTVCQYQHLEEEALELGGSE